MTTDRATLLGLADRCEKAGGPDGVLDRDIAIAAGWRPAPNEYGDDTPWLIPPGQEVGPWVRHPPAFTASLDAALSLVPDGWRKMVDDLDRTPEAIVSTPDQKRSWDGRAATMPLALTAAALRALAQEAASHDD